VTDNMLAAAAHAVSQLVDTGTPGAPLLPPVEALRETSLAVAAAVAQAAAGDGVATADLAEPGEDARGRIRALMWEPVYRPVRAA
jgi:malate dehydrogenase (oxaloacetate-decarboxylating)